MKVLSPETFRLVIENAPLFALDLVIINEENELLVGKRLNPPAKDMWFIPGGRVFKNETFENAFKRISETELGILYKYPQAQLLGIFEHLYDDSIFGKELSTHYITAPHFIRVKTSDLKLPYGQQHNAYRWVKLSKVELDETIHIYSKAFMPKLLNLIADC